MYDAWRLLKRGRSLTLLLTSFKSGGSDCIDSWIVNSVCVQKIIPTNESQILWNGICSIGCTPQMKPSVAWGWLVIADSYNSTSYSVPTYRPDGVRNSKMDSDVLNQFGTDPSSPGSPPLHLACPTNFPISLLIKDIHCSHLPATPALRLAPIPVSSTRQSVIHHTIGRFRERTQPTIYFAGHTAQHPATPASLLFLTIPFEPPTTALVTFVSRSLVWVGAFVV